MKTWEKVQQLDQQYTQARQQLALGLVEAVEIKITRKPRAQIKDASKQAARNNNK